MNKNPMATVTVTAAAALSSLKFSPVAITCTTNCRTTEVLEKFHSTNDKENNVQRAVLCCGLSLKKQPKGGYFHNLMPILGISRRYMNFCDGDGSNGNGDENYIC